EMEIASGVDADDLIATSNRHAGTFVYRADDGHTGRQTAELRTARRRHGETQLVVVTACGRTFRRAVGRAGHQVEVDVCTDAARLAEVPEIGDETIGDVDRRARDPSERTTQRDLRLRQVIPPERVQRIFRSYCAHAFARRWDNQVIAQ